MYAGAQVQRSHLSFLVFVFMCGPGKGINVCDDTAVTCTLYYSVEYSNSHGIRTVQNTCYIKRQIIFFSSERTLINYIMNNTLE